MTSYELDFHQPDNTTSRTHPEACLRHDAHWAGASLRDVQMLAGHRSIETTQGYIDGDSDAQRRLVSMI